MVSILHLGILAIYFLQDKHSKIQLSFIRENVSNIRSEESERPCICGRVSIFPLFLRFLGCIFVIFVILLYFLLFFILFYMLL